MIFLMLLPVRTIQINKKKDRGPNELSVMLSNFTRGVVFVHFAASNDCTPKLTDPIATLFIRRSVHEIIVVFESNLKCMGMASLVVRAHHRDCENS